MDTRLAKIEIQKIRETIIDTEQKLNALYDYLHAFEEKILDQEEEEINLWFDKIRQTVLTKSA